MCNNDFFKNHKENISCIVFREHNIQVKNFTDFQQIEHKKKFKHFFKIAKNLSLTSDYQKYRLGSIIVIQGKIVAKGVNSSKTHPLQKKLNEDRDDFNCFTTHPIHAEVSTLNKVKHLDLKKAEMFIYHASHEEQPKFARPCLACMNAIINSGIKTIHYSTADGFATEYLSSSVSHIHKVKNT